jgi:hypothetical protein
LLEEVRFLIEGGRPLIGIADALGTTTGAISRAAYRDGDNALARKFRAVTPHWRKRV